MIHVCRNKVLLLGEKKSLNVLNYIFFTKHQVNCIVMRHFALQSILLQIWKSILALLKIYPRKHLLSAVWKVLTHDAIMRWEKSRVNGQVCWRSRVGLDIDAPFHWVQIEGLEGSVLAKNLNFIDDFISSIISGNGKWDFNFNWITRKSFWDQRAQFHSTAWEHKKCLRTKKICLPIPV